MPKNPKRPYPGNTGLILASASPARAKLLRADRIPFTQIPSGIAEPEWIPGKTSFEEHLIRLAEQKADNIAEKFPEAFIIGADTAILCENRMIGKGLTPDKTKEILHTLSGKQHSITTGVCVTAPANQENCRKKQKGHDTAYVTLTDLSDKDIDLYMESSDVTGCAGGYALQDTGISIIRRIDGDSTTVIGLPMNLTKNLLKNAGYPMPDKTSLAGGG